MTDVVHATIAQSFLTEGKLFLFKFIITKFFPLFFCEKRKLYFKENILTDLTVSKNTHDISQLKIS
jgi:hypothetical protein